MHEGITKRPTLALSSRAPRRSSFIASRPARRGALVSTLAGLALASGACSGGDDRPAPAAPGMTTGATPTLTPPATCTPGSVQVCSITLGENNGILSCYEGIQECGADGRFGACKDGEYFELERAEVEARFERASRPLALGPASACTGNPCNAYCRQFDEVPPGGALLPDPDPGAEELPSYRTGDVSKYSEAARALGAREPCNLAGDCQMNQVCQDPAAGSCEHPVCSTGDALAAGCSACSDAVCALDASCCGETTVCAHDPCTTGAALAPACDQCVQAVCGAHPECCSAGWDEACVGYVATLCAPLGQSCGCPQGALAIDGACYALGDGSATHAAARDACTARGSGWDLIQVDGFGENAIAAGLMEIGDVSEAWIGASSVVADEWRWLASGLFFDSGALVSPFDYENWDDGEPGPGPGVAASMTGDTGRWRAADASEESAYVCEGVPDTLTPKRPTVTWGDHCVDLVERACGARCPEDGAALGLGTCRPRIQTDLDASCASFDLALGATCLDGTPQVPVCNHGTLAAPAGLTLVHLPAGQLGATNPDLSAAESCSLSAPIPAGSCVVIEDCPNLTAGRQLVINPGGAGQDTSECHPENNWSVYEPLACAAPLCEARLHAPPRTPAACTLEVQNAHMLDTDAARVVLGAGARAPSCGEDEILFGGSCYFVSSETASWNEARARCQARGTGWELIALNTAFENVMAREWVEPDESVHIGFNDLDTEGEHVWSNGSCVGWVNWGAEQPDDAGGIQDCASMSAVSSIYDWEDRSCTDNTARYICEGPVRDARGGCEAGQLEGPNGDCYRLLTTPATYAAARSACQALGASWDLARIDSYDTSDFLAANSQCLRTWFSLPDNGFEDWDTGEPTDLGSNCPSFGDSFGFWRDESCSNTLAAFCQGPRVPGGGSVLTRVADAAACSGDDQYYFADGVAPESLSLCPDACDRAMALGAPLEVQIGCTDTLVRAAETVVTERYEADCGNDEPQWDFLFYDTETPADSAVRFAVRTAATEAELVGGFQALATAQAGPVDTQRCEASPPDCPINLFGALGSPGYRHPFLELRMTLVPGTNGEAPLVRDWRVQFSCLPSQ